VVELPHTGHTTPPQHGWLQRLRWIPIPEIVCGEFNIIILVMGVAIESENSLVGNVVEQVVSSGIYRLRDMNVLKTMLPIYIDDQTPVKLKTPPKAEEKHTKVVNPSRQFRT
jgi:hypothetical protein